jgi:hypothetical protein
MEKFNTSDKKTSDRCDEDNWNPLERGKMDEKKFQAIVDQRIENCKQKYQKDKERLLLDGVDERDIIYVNRNGIMRGKFDYYSTLGCWFYDLKDASDFLNTYSGVGLINSNDEFIMDCYAMDGSNLKKMKDDLRGAIDDDPVGWKKHKSKYESKV